MVLYPHKIFYYKSIITSLQDFVKQPEFLKNCESWRHLPTLPGQYHDIYDGNIWKQFQVYEGRPFLSTALSFGFTANVDWFQPFKHSQYSVGAVYLAVMNLPRHLRFRRENLILCGLIPGPNEPMGTMNQFWRPIVDDLLQLWQGVMMTLYGAQETKIVLAALLCLACNLPGRKACGLLGHMAILGCSRCKKTLPEIEDIPWKFVYARNQMMSWLESGLSWQRVCETEIA